MIKLIASDQTIQNKNLSSLLSAYFPDILNSNDQDKWGFRYSDMDET